MSEDENNREDETRAQADAAADAAAEDQAAASEDAAEEAIEFSASDALEAEIASLKDRLLRAVAETENVRRRAQRDQADASSYAVTGFARDVLVVSDNLHRTLDNLPEELAENEAVKTFVDAIEMTEREMINMLEKHGIQKIVPKGEKFDHHRHQAMFEIEDATVPPGTILQVMQPGYMIKDRLLRPAMVGVAKGGKKPGDADTHVDTTV